MKNNFLTHLTTLIIATALIIATTVLMSCSKDESIINAPETSAISASTGKWGPLNEGGGSVSGTFEPIPATAGIAIRKSEWLLVGQTNAEKGSFMISHIPEGEYYLTIRYTLQANSDEHVIILPGILIKENETTNLGTIILE